MTDVKAIDATARERRRRRKVELFLCTHRPCAHEYVRAHCFLAVLACTYSSRVVCLFVHDCQSRAYGLPVRAKRVGNRPLIQFW